MRLLQVRRVQRRRRVAQLARGARDYLADAHELERDRAVLGDGDRAAHALEHAFHERARRLVVVYDEDAGAVEALGLESTRASAYGSLEGGYCG